MPDGGRAIQRAAALVGLHWAMVQSAAHRARARGRRARRGPGRCAPDPGARRQPWALDALPLAIAQREWLGVSKALAHEVEPFGVRVVFVEPGPYRTDIFGRNRTVGTESPHLQNGRIPMSREGSVNGLCIAWRGTTWKLT